MSDRTLSLLGSHLGVARLGPDDPLPHWAVGRLVCLTRTADELSVVCDEARVPAGVRCERGWRALKLEGPFDFDLIGVLLPVAEALARAGVSLLALSTFDTDYVLVKEARLAEARSALKDAGYRIVETP